MGALYYDGSYRLRNDAEALARRIGVEGLPRYYDFGVYAGWTRGEVENWHCFADLIERTKAFLADQGTADQAASFHPHPGQSGSRSLRWCVDHNGIEVLDQESFRDLCAAWDAFLRRFLEMRERQPMFRLEELVSEYCRNSEEGWPSSWFYAYMGQCKLLDWAERGCSDPLPFKEMKHVVTPAFREELADIRARRIGWLLHLGDEREYHLVYCDEEAVVAFQDKHCGGRTDST